MVSPGLSWVESIVFQNVTAAFFLSTICIALWYTLKILTDPVDVGKTAKLNWYSNAGILIVGNPLILTINAPETKTTSCVSLFTYHTTFAIEKISHEFDY